MTSWTVLARIVNNYLRNLTGLAKNFIPLNAGPQAIEAVMSNEQYNTLAEEIAKRMVISAATVNARTWRDAAAKWGQGRRLSAALQSELSGHVGYRLRELVRQNADLIKTLPSELAQRATAYTAEMALRGARAGSIEKGLAAQMPSFALSRLKLIARTEVGKTETALTRARAEGMGLNWYHWETSEDQRVRLAHRKMQGVLVNWDDAPAPEILVGETSAGHYHAGNIWNCRCLALPLVSSKEVSWPHRVYQSGRIQYMTLAEFQRLNPQRIAA